MRTRKPSLAVMLLAALVLACVGIWMGQTFKPAQINRPSIEAQQQPNSRGEWISGSFGVQVYDARSGELVWAAPIDEPFPYLVGDHYLVGIRTGKLEAIDLDSALATPIDQDKRRHHRFEKLSGTFDGFLPSQNTLHVPIKAIPGGNRFLLHVFTDSNMTVSTVVAFEIQAQSIVELSRWTSGPINSNVAITPGGLIVSPTANDQGVEVREPTKFELLRTMPLPTGMISWTQGRPHNDLLSVLNFQSKITRVYRLEDLSFVMETDASPHTISQEFGDDRRYHLFTGGQSAKGRLLVYDAVDKRIAHDSQSAGENMAIRDGQLIVQSATCGLTRKFIDLKSGQVRVERPYLWIVIGLPILLLAALAWLVRWIAGFSAAAEYLPLNIAWVSLLFVAPLQWRIAQTRMTIFPGRFMSDSTIPYVFAVVLAIFFCLVMLAAFSKARLATRCLPLFLAIALLYTFIYIFNSIDFEAATPFEPEVKSLRTWMMFTLVSAICLGGARMLGQRVTLDVVSDSNDAAARPPRSQLLFSGIRLADIFLLTTVLAACMTLFGPQIDLLLATEAGMQVFGQSCLLVAAASLGLVALAPSQTTYVIATRIALALAVILIFDIASFVGFRRTSRIWGLLILVRYPVFLSLCVFTFCSMMRQAGYRWRGRDAGTLA